MKQILRPTTRAEEYEFRAKYLKEEYHMSGDGPRSTEFRIDKVLRLVPFQKDDVVLDISVGKGLLFERIHDKVKECHGTDVSQAMIVRVREKFNRYPNVKFERAFSSRLPYPDAMFDKVLMTGAFCLQETVEECKQSLAEIRRVAKPSATIFISDIAVRDESRIQPEELPALLRVKRRITQDGPVEFLSTLRRYTLQKARQLSGREPVLVESNGGIWFPHETFVRMCNENKLEASGFQTQMILGPSPTRFDYLLKALAVTLSFFATHALSIFNFLSFVEAL